MLIIWLLGGVVCWLGCCFAWLIAVALVCLICLDCSVGLLILVWRVVSLAVWLWLFVIELLLIVLGVECIVVFVCASFVIVGCAVCLAWVGWFVGGCDCC